MTIYDPQGALTRPVAVDVHRANFGDTRIRVRCLSDDQLPPGDAETLCRRLATLFRNQGAEVDTEVPRGPRYAAAGWDDSERPDLILELDSKLVHKESSVVLASISGITLTSVPNVEEETFEQGIMVRDARGSVLAAERPRARFVTYLGWLVWSATWLLDVFVREPEDELTGDTANKAFSRDFYALVTQLAFNARVRQRLMRSIATSPPSDAGGAPPSSRSTPAPATRTPPPPPAALPPAAPPPTTTPGRP